MPLASSKDIPAQLNQTMLTTFVTRTLLATKVEFHDDIDNRVVYVEGKITHRSSRRPLRCRGPRDIRLFRFIDYAHVVVYEDAQPCPPTASLSCDETVFCFPQDVGGAHEAYATGWPA